MIKTEIATFNGKEYIRTWSDQSMMIERDGALYQEAIDPIDSGRTYTETDIPIDADENDEYATAGKILMGVEE